MFYYLLSRKCKWAPVFLCLLLTSFTYNNVSGQPVLNYTPFITGLSSPLDIVNASDGSNRLFVVQRNGVIRIHNGSSLLATPFINIQDSIQFGGEQGLLSLAFHPDYETNRYFFVWYTDKEGDLTLARYRTTLADPNIADQQSEVVLLEIPKPGTPYFTNHNGGKILFGSDNYLYVSTGDGGSGGDPFDLAQNGNSLLGKMLRIDVNNFSTPPYYSIPPDNPFVSNPSVRDEIWALGLRNPWRWSFDRLTGDMWIADVGQGDWEEVNIRTAGNTAGVNYGWRCYEGNSTYNTTGCGPSSNYVFPIFAYPRDFATGGRSVTGGHVYRGTEFPLLSGWYVCADYVSGNTWKIAPNGTGGWRISQQNGLPGNIAGFGEAENGALYAISLSSGTVYRVEANSALPLKLTEFNAVKKNNQVLIEWKTSYESNLLHFEIEWSKDGIMFSRISIQPASNNTNGSRYSFLHLNPANQKNFYRIRTVEQNKDAELSGIVVINYSNEDKISVNPTLVTQRTININANKPVQGIRLFSTAGKEVYRQDFQNRQGSFWIQFPHLPRGAYFIHILSKGENSIQKIVIQ
jgi:glucose/arabinose dehydrogenase